MSRERTSLLAVIMGALLVLNGCGGLEEDFVSEDSDLDEDAKADSATKVKVSTDKAQYGLQDLIGVSVANGYKVTAIYLPGCDATRLQQKTATGWKDLGPEKCCVWEGFAIKVAAGTTLKDSFGPKPAGTYRAKVVYKTGCTTKQTFSQCKGAPKTAYSTAFKVGQPTGACTTDKDCATTEFCKLAEGQCLLPTMNLLTGTCKERPQYCIEIYAPVCGCDGQTYGNSCFADAAGVSVAQKGECAPKATECETLGGYCLPLTNPAVQPTCKTGEHADTGTGCGTGGLLGQSTTCCLPAKACWGAWLDQYGNCRGPADGVLPAGCCK